LAVTLPEATLAANRVATQNVRARWWAPQHDPARARHDIVEKARRNDGRFQLDVPSGQPFAGAQRLRWSLDGLRPIHTDDERTETFFRLVQNSPTARIVTVEMAIQLIEQLVDLQCAVHVERASIDTHALPLAVIARNTASSGLNGNSSEPPHKRTTS